MTAAGPEPERTFLPLFRAGGVSCEELEGLCLPDTAALLDRAAESEAAMRSVEPLLEEALYRLVPSLAEAVDLRRTALTLRRDIHNLRSPRADVAGQLGALAEHLGPESESLAAWLAAAAEREAALSEARQVMEMELARAGRSVVELARGPDLLRGLVLASPEFARELLRLAPAAEARPGTRLARSCVAYVSRAAVKTSPFSSLTKIGLPGRPAGGRRRLTVSTALARTLLDACALDPRSAPALELEPNPSICPGSPQARILAAERACVDGFFWSHEEVVDASVAQRQVQVAADIGRAGYQAYLAGLGGRQPDAAVARMLETDLLRVVLPWPDSHPNPFSVLAAAVGGRLPGALGSQLKGLARAVAEFGEADGARRLQLLEGVRGSAREALSGLGQTPPSWMDTSGLIYEDVEADAAIADLPAALAGDLRKLGSLVRPGAFRTRTYQELVDQFVASHGRGGHCSDVVGFLTAFMEGDAARSVFQRVHAADMLTMSTPPDTLPAVGESSTPPSLSVFFQLAAADEAALARGDYLLVVNQLNPGVGGLVARFVSLFGPDELARSLRGWLEGLVAPAVPHEVRCGADWSTLQGQAHGVLPLLEWPGGLGGSGLSARQLVLVHEPVGDTLTLLGPDGRAIVPVYLGTVPQFLVVGPVRLLLSLGDPWLNGSRIGDVVNPFLPQDAAPADVEFTPRVQEGRIVLRRARWRAPAPAFPVWAKGEADFEYMRRADTWRRSHGIPREVFMTADRRTRSLDAKHRKPLWLRFDSLHALRAIEQLVGEEGTTTINLVEALPGRDQHWLREASGKTRACEFVAMMSWPRPGPVAPVARVPAPPCDRHAPATPWAGDYGREWLYYQLFPGGHGRMEGLLRELVPAAIETARRSGADRWFFLRYLDERGPHVRLRFRGPDDVIDVAQPVLDRLLNEGLRALAAGPDEAPMQLLNISRNALAGGDHVGVGKRLYEPEWDKYGGAGGVDLAERFFQVSSEVALELLRATGSDRGRRAAAALALMGASAPAILSASEPLDFWERYVAHWSGGGRAGSEALRGYATRAAAHVAATLPAAARELGQDPGFAALLGRYVERLQGTVTESARLGTSVPATELLFHHTHLTNNRLGLTAVDEAFLAAVLLHGEPGGAPAPAPESELVPVPVVAAQPA